ncbi:hypothetical protein [Maricaulis sp.]|uniref:hypothetical protein n=1 Tax=Maricaulis sp. TaxID=1486257 RepID=UPI002621591B|nr:hypothetical protein [Maricaulis sp.]MDF1767369.1 hypothetical protein [Maricaulis sp.]
MGQLSLPDRFVLSLWCLGFAVGTSTHLMDIFSRGIFAYTYAPFWMNAFWTSLTLLDPLVVALLLLVRRAGIVLGGMVMVADLAINTYAGTLPAMAPGSYQFVLQWIFGLFVFATAGRLWPAPRS